MAEELVREPWIGRGPMVETSSTATGIRQNNTVVASPLRQDQQGADDKRGEHDRARSTFTGARRVNFAPTYEPIVIPIMAPIRCGTETSP